MSLQAPNKFSSVQISTSHSHARQTSVASFASSLYLPVDPENKPGFDDETEAYPSSDELFGPDHEEGDDYTISSRRYLSSHSRYSSSFSHASHPPTPPRSTISLERSSSSLSLTPPQARYGNRSSLAPINRSAADATTSLPAALPSPPSTARSSNDNHMDEAAAPKPDEGVPVEKFDQLVVEHLERDRALLDTLRRLDDQKTRIAQLTYALSRLRVLSNSACLLPENPSSSNRPKSNLPVEFRRLGAIVPKPLIVKPSAYSASSSTLGRSTFGTRSDSSGLTGPSLNEAINQRRHAKQQLHEFALRRPTRNAKVRPNGRFAARGHPDASQTKRTEWEGARGSPSMVLREAKPRAAGIINHPNVTTRRAKLSEPPRQPTAADKMPRPPSSTLGPATPPRLTSLFSSPSPTTTRSPLTPTQSQILPTAIYDSPTTPIAPRHNKPLPPRPISPTLPMRLARNVSYTYTIPPVPPPHETTAHVTLVDNAETVLPLPAEEVQSRLAATFAHFAKPRAPPSPPRLPSPPRRALDMTSSGQPQPDYLEQLLHKKWVEQLDEHAHQARGSWKSPLRNIRQKIAGGFGLARRSSRASIGESSSEAHTQPNMSLDGNGGYVHGLGTVEEGVRTSGGMDEAASGKPLLTLDHHKLKRPRKKGSIKEEDAHTPQPATPSSTSGGIPNSKPAKSTWRFSRIGQSHS
ncbi:hypothetical protein RhiJN_03144 [Ceratobasidium sp. AG-Ba]|nr:hypothetical protein RhiJN_03144 [Ceratobasidium sp. AG-Ba]